MYRRGRHEADPQRGRCCKGGGPRHRGADTLAIVSGRGRCRAPESLRADLRSQQILRQGLLDIGASAAVHVKRFVLDPATARTDIGCKRMRSVQRSRRRQRREGNASEGAHLHARHLCRQPAGRTYPVRRRLSRSSVKKCTRQKLRAPGGIRGQLASQKINFATIRTAASHACLQSRVAHQLSSSPSLSVESAMSAQFEQRNGPNLCAELVVMALHMEAAWPF
eukprot:CAMPEP_0204117848 /NCGR_PEP_ID=MMETSP0361-20130328/6212_1 /ASSEMBLY_ACC=CAM_ASM_000343 /TAXON_ID=268821 /ORGANISM="Scrippsiella Hangoei, Strain SHTV-5" /LENGTH=222 /DNA_ID=CAMNT_0051068799 /DNA_START=151 /DNA_END=820 /DNA_ORIENTATION=-